jgi:hypothetical protein
MHGAYEEKAKPPVYAWLAAFPPGVHPANYFQCRLHNDARRFPPPWSKIRLG